MGGTSAVVQDSSQVESMSLNDAHSVETKVEPEYNTPRTPSVLLHRNWWPFVFCLPYAVAAIISWVVICVQTSHPIGASQYDFWQGRNLSANDPYFDKEHLTYMQYQQQFQSNEAWYHAARVGQSILAIFTIPLTSAICSYAAVVFAQAPRPRGKLTLQQTMALSDRGWTDPMVIGKLFTQLRRYGSSLLIIAVVLNIIGATVPPLQAILTIPISVKGSGSAVTLASVTDPISILGSPPRGDFTYNDNSLILLTKSAIETTFSDSLQVNLWSHGQVAKPTTGGGLNNLMNLTNLIDPFYAPIASTVNTGLLTQYLPRMNSSATVQNITAADWPKNCTNDGAFFVQYNHTGAYDFVENPNGNWSFLACMPGNQSQTPWLATRDRQDISETLYVNVSMFSDIMPNYEEATEAFIGLYKITLDTTMGMFELPNYANGGTAGPLLAKDPLTTYLDPQDMPDQYRFRRGIDNATIGISNSTIILESAGNKGPLLTLAMAMFGENSFLYGRFHNPYQHVIDWNPDRYHINDEEDEELFSSMCVELPPLLGLMYAQYQSRGVYLGNEWVSLMCLQKTLFEDDVQRNTESWLMLFAGLAPSEILVNGFEAAAFLTNQIWYNRQISQPLGPTSYLGVTADMGQDTLRPYISLVGKVIVSILLGAYLLALLGLCCYASFKPTWTSTLDAFAMMRIGATMSEDLPLKCASAGAQLEILNSPGWLGDVTEGDGRVGALAVGASGPLRLRRPMQTYN